MKTWRQTNKTNLFCNETQKILSITNQKDVQGSTITLILSWESSQYLKIEAALPTPNIYSFISLHQ